MDHECPARRPSPVRPPALPVTGRPVSRASCAATARPSTADLLARAGAGEAPAWEGLVERLSGLPWSVARSHRLPTEDCANVVQATWLRLLEDPDAVRDAERLPGWLVTTARRECLRSRRAAGRVPPVDHLDTDHLDTDDVAHGTREPLDAALLREERDARLWYAFAQLPPGCQALLRLLLAEPAPSYDDVAAALDRPVAAIGPTRGRCLARLRAVLDRGPDSGACSSAPDRGRS